MVGTHRQDQQLCFSTNPHVGVVSCNLVFNIFNFAIELFCKDSDNAFRVFFIQSTIFMACDSHFPSFKNCAMQIDICILKLFHLALNCFVYLHFIGYSGVVLASKHPWIIGRILIQQTFKLKLTVRVFRCAHTYTFKSKLNGYLLIFSSVVYNTSRCLIFNHNLIKKKSFIRLSPPSTLTLIERKWFLPSGHIPLWRKSSSAFLLNYFISRGHAQSVSLFAARLIYSQVMLQFFAPSFSEENAIVCVVVYTLIRVF